MEKKGIGYIRSVVEDSKCIFRQFLLEDDYGIDAIIELTKNDNLTGIMFAAQIKSGRSYCNKTSCHVRSDKKHFEYWSKYSLPVIVIVYDPSERAAYWHNITSFLTKNIIKNGPYTISFNKNNNSRFDSKSIKSFIPKTKPKKPSRLKFKTAVMYSMSTDHDRFQRGVYSLLKDHIRSEESWNVLFTIFRTKPPPGLHGELIDLLSSIIDHHNMWWYGGYTRNLPFEDSIRKRMMEFTKDDVIRMLSFIYEEDDFTRIHTSKRINDVLTLISKRKEMIREIVNDKSLPLRVRESALMFSSCWEGRKILAHLKIIKRNHPELENRITFVRSFFKSAKNQDDMYCFD